MGKKKKLKQKDVFEFDDDAEYDYSDIHEDPDTLRETMKKMADALECYKDYIETYAIFEGITEKEWEENMKLIKKLIKKLRRGDPSVFDISALNDVLDSDHNLIVGLYS